MKLLLFEVTIVKEKPVNALKNRYQIVACKRKMIVTELQKKTIKRKFHKNLEN